MVYDNDPAGHPETDEMIRLIGYVSSTVLDSAPFEQRINGILSCVVTAFHSDACIVRELSGRKLHLLAVSGVEGKFLASSMPANQGIAGTLLETQRGLIIDDVATDPITASLHASSPAGHFRFSHYAGAPMLVRAKPIGVLGIYRIADAAGFTQRDLSHLEIVANQLAVSLQNNRQYLEQLGQSAVLQRAVRQRERTEVKLQAQLRRAEELAASNQLLAEKLQCALDEVSQAYDATLEGWCAALDLRDEGTMGHTKRVTELAVNLAERVNYPLEAMSNLRRGALLHDIGKMGIPDSILLKPGPLSEEEWMIMKRHPELAYDFLRRVEFLHSASDIPFCHHEHWDGSGYPRGLRGAAIPAAARIFAVVDVWDALRSDRPYRRAWPKDKVATHILQNRGTHFDPEVVDAFLTLIETGIPVGRA
ncbi:MAG: HD domain-containing phosphohydrolase [Candidatus Sumerlaeaceae bacterium]